MTTATPRDAGLQREHPAEGQDDIAPRRGRASRSFSDLGDGLCCVALLAAAIAGLAVVVSFVASMPTVR